MKISSLPYSSLLLLVLLAWSSLNTRILAQTTVSYQQEIESWHAKRVENLKAPAGWLNLVGLYWLDEGENSFGTGLNNKLVFPGGCLPEEAGIFERNGSTVTLNVLNNASIKVNDKPVTVAVIFDKETVRPPVVSAGSLSWTIIRRDDKIGVRLRDLQSPLATGFTDIDRYAVDTSWRIPATLQQTEGAAQSIAIKNILGQTNQQKTPGKLVFSIHGRQYTLDALEEGDELFIIFADETSGKTTYASGRFLSVKKPSSDGKTVIDFNKAYNPPCAFTNYATCPLPPKQNVLPVAVTAGEKNYGHHAL